jgi:hypothetical protein
LSSFDVVGPVNIIVVSNKDLLKNREKKLTYGPRDATNVSWAFFGTSSSSVVPVIEKVSIVQKQKKTTYLMLRLKSLLLPLLLLPLPLMLMLPLLLLLPPTPPRRTVVARLWFGGREEDMGGIKERENSVSCVTS